MVLISGGSSIGSKDYTLEAIKGIKNFKIIAQGIAMRPGKQTLLAIIDGKPVIGLPGHPVSSVTAFHVFVRPVIKHITGNPRSFWQEKKGTVKIDAILAKDVESMQDMADYVRVRLKLLDNGKITAYPYAGKSSFISTLVKAHGIIKLVPDCTKLYEGDRVEVVLF
jgi:molybdopterin molybdotransferase